MTCNTDVPIDETYYLFSGGWYPHSGQGTSWAFEAPPGGSIIPDQEFCGLYFEPTTATDEEELMPDAFSLSQNFPNPFNAQTTIIYDLPIDSDVRIEIYDALGRKTEMLVKGWHPAGMYTTIWNAEDLPSGLYFYSIRAGDYTASRSCVLLK